MAEKKTASRAEQAVSGAKKKTSSGSASKPSGKKSTSAKNTKYKTEYERAVPPHFLIAAVSILLFALFVVISVNPDGKLLEIIQSVVLGLVGQAGFYFAIPGLLYLFVIHTFGRKNAPTMRSVCKPSKLVESFLPSSEPKVSTPPRTIRETVSSGISIPMSSMVTRPPKRT